MTLWWFSNYEFRLIRQKQTTWIYLKNRNRSQPHLHAISLVHIGLIVRQPAGVYALQGTHIYGAPVNDYMRWNLLNRGASERLRKIGFVLRGQVKRFVMKFCSPYSSLLVVKLQQLADRLIFPTTSEDCQHQLVSRIQIHLGLICVSNIIWHDGHSIRRLTPVFLSSETMCAFCLILT